VNNSNSLLTGIVVHVNGENPVGFFARRVAFQGALFVEIILNKRKTMSIIITKANQTALKVDQTDFELEDKMQKYIHENPDCIPLYEIDDDIKIVILARELGTESGPIDAVGTDRNGNIYLVETKLERNTDRRKITSQILDYGASLWRHTRDPNDFISQLEDKVLSHSEETLNDRLKDFFNISDEDVEKLTENIKINLKEGAFKFIILMDKLEDRLKDLIVFINQNSNFDLYAVELEYYKYQDFEITIPRLFGAEVKKNVSTGIKRTPSKAFSDEEFLENWKDSQYSNKAKAFLELCNRLEGSNDSIEVAKNPKRLNLYMKYKGWKENDYPDFFILPNEPTDKIVLLADRKRYEEAKTLTEEIFPYAEIKKGIKGSHGGVADIYLKDLDIGDIEKYVREIN
jgi:hypothetical protein